MDFLGYLKKYEKEDVSGIKNILETKKQKMDAIIEASFYGDFVSKEEAIMVVENDMIEGKIDKTFLAENKKEVLDTINTLSEGEIKIIINNDIDKSKHSAPEGCPMSRGSVEPVTSVITIDDEDDDLDLEMESACSTKKKPGRPKKKVVENTQKVDFKTEDAEEQTPDLEIEESETDVDCKECGSKTVDGKCPKCASQEINEAENEDTFEDADVEEETEEETSEEEESTEDVDEDEEEEVEGDLKWSDIEAKLDNIEDKIDDLITHEENEEEEESDEDSDEEGDEPTEDEDLEEGVIKEGVSISRKMLSEARKLSAKQKKLLDSRDAIDWEDLSQEDQTALYRMRDYETLWSDVTRYLGDK